MFSSILKILFYFCYLFSKDKKYLSITSSWLLLLLDFLEHFWKIVSKVISFKPRNFMKIKFIETCSNVSVKTHLMFCLRLKEQYLISDESTWSQKCLLTETEWCLRHAKVEFPTNAMQWPRLRSILSFSWNSRQILKKNVCLWRRIRLLIF